MTEVIFATASPTRLALLAAAGVPCRGQAAPVDETSVKESMRAEGASALDTALLLAELKAIHLSRRNPDALVFGADQMLECEGRWYDKPADLAAARDQLCSLRGKGHKLISAVVCARAGQRLWHFSEEAKLRMRPFGDDFLEEYLASEGEALLGSVGAYRLEGRGAQLFAAIEGDYFSILGLPLLAVLDYLRVQGVLPL